MGLAYLKEHAINGVRVVEPPFFVRETFIYLASFSVLPSTKRFPLLRGEAAVQPREYLFIAVDDHRFAI